MEKEFFSEDYRRLSLIKLDMTEEKVRAESDFFFRKYSSFIATWCKKFLSALDDDPSMQEHEREAFLDAVQDKYIPQAIRSFNPQIITNKQNYAFATYLSFYLKHAVRDLHNHIIKEREQTLISNEAPKTESPSAEELALKKMEENRQKKIHSEVLKKLSPLDLEILCEMEKGKKQNQIKIINPKTGKAFSTGYICKRTAQIRKCFLSVKNRYD